MSQHYATHRRYNGKNGGKGRLAYARTIGDGVAVIPDVALTVPMYGPLVTKPRTVEIRTLSAGSFVAYMDGVEIACGGIVGIFTAIGQRIPACFAAHED